MGLFDNLKTIGNVLQEVGKIELYQQLLEFSATLLKFQHENSELNKEIEVLKEKLKIRDMLYFDNNAYWTEPNKDGPFCCRCWDKNKDIIRMQNNNNIYFTCPECKNVYQGPEYYKLSLQKPRSEGGSWMIR